MKSIRYYLYPLFFLAFLSAPVAQAQDDLEFDTLLVRQVGPGVTHFEYIERTTPWTLDVLEVDLTNPYLMIETANAQELVANGYETTSSMAARNDSAGHRVVGAVNGDFYSGSSPVSLQIQDGEAVVNNMGSGRRVAVGFDPEDHVMMERVAFSTTLATNDTSVVLGGVNEGRDSNELVLYNSFWGDATRTGGGGTEIAVLPLEEWAANDTVRVVVTQETTAGNTPISENGAVLSGAGTAAGFLSQLAVNDTLSLLVNVLPGLPLVDDMIGGQPFIVQNGVANVGGRGDRDQRHPRTAVGFSQDSTTLYFVTVDGRQQTSAGMTLFELADFMAGIGIHTAMNVDGGGSSTMVVRGGIVNAPSDGGQERSIGSNAFLVVSTAPEGPLNGVQISPTTDKVFMGRTIEFSVRGHDEYYNTVALDPEKITYSADPDLGTINDDGLLTSGMQQDTGYVYVHYDQQFVDSAQVIVKTIAAFDLYPPEVTTDSSHAVSFYVRAFDQDGFEQSTALGTYQWTSTNPSVGTVENGFFQGISPGTTTIVAGFRSLSDSAVVHVVENEGTNVFLSLEDMTGWTLMGEYIDVAASELSVTDSAFTEGSGSFRVDYSYELDPTKLKWVYLRTDVPIEGVPDSMHIDVLSSNEAYNQVYLLIEDVQGNLFRVFTRGFANVTNEFIELSGAFADANALEGDPTLYYPVRLKGISLKVRYGTEAGATYNETMFLDNLRLTYSTATNLDEPPASIPASITLYGNHPNPFRESTTISYGLPRAAPVVLEIYDVLGRRIRTLRPGLQPAGRHNLHIETLRLPAGVYFYRLKTGEGTAEGSMVRFK